MKNKGRRHKRAVDALNKIHLGEFSSCSKGYVLSTSKNHPNYFTAMLWNDWGKRMDSLLLCIYLNVYA